MAAFGYEIVNVLVTDIVPDAKVKSAMNDINAAQREQVAASARGEADKILVVKKAEAEAESKALQGQGIANQRKAIVEGLQTSIEQFQKAVEGATSQDVMQLVLVTQYFDTLKSHRRKRQDQHAVPVALARSSKEVSDQILNRCWWRRTQRTDRVLLPRAASPREGGNPRTSTQPRSSRAQRTRIRFSCPRPD